MNIGGKVMAACVIMFFSSFLVSSIKNRLGGDGGTSLTLLTLVSPFYSALSARSKIEHYGQDNAPNLQKSN